MSLRNSTRFGYWLGRAGKTSHNTLCQTHSHVSAVGIAVEPAAKPSYHPRSMHGDVLVSTCRDVYSNLAFEDWIYQNGNVTDDQKFNLMFLWRNDPCVVIGRHQNVWVECNVLDALSDNVNVVRRRSGGGTVYHDNGNLNITFFTSRKGYDRKQNLTMIAEALREQCSLHVAVSKRDDILINDAYKISGTAAKLGSKVAYHHCTLLLDAKLGNVKKYLQGIPGIKSKATASVRMPVANVSEYAPQLTYGESLRLLTEAYRCRHPGEKFGFTYVNPTDESAFPGISAMRTELKQWDWIYGHTPKFTVARTFACHVGGRDARVNIDAEIDHGRIGTISITVDGCEPETSDRVHTHCGALAVALTGCRLWPDEIALCVRNTNSDFVELVDWSKCVSDCIVNFACGR